MTELEKEIIYHLSKDDLNRLLTKADNEKESKRLILVKNLLHLTDKRSTVFRRNHP